MLAPNRSVPAALVIPVLAYPLVRPAVEFLVATFGFTERLRIADHRAQLDVGDGGAVIVAEYIDRHHRPAPDARYTSHQIMVRIADVRAHHARCAARGAEILEVPEDFPYGERQYVVRDPGGHRWIFSQTLADVDPQSFLRP